MSAWRKARATALRLVGLIVHRGNRHEFDDEIEGHLQMHIDDLMRSGMPMHEARQVAALQLGGIEQTRQKYRERSTSPPIDNLLQDLRFALRQLRRNPGFTVTATIMLALGIGASVAIFAFVDAALFKPLPYLDPARLVAVFESSRLFDRDNLSYPDYLDWKRMNRSFTSIDIYRGGGGLLSLSTGAVPVDNARVSDGFFRTLGVAPIIGRDFYTGEDLPGAGNTVILSYAAWQKWYRGRPDAIGKKIILDGTPETIIGVLPASFDFAPTGGTEFWLPFHAKGSCDLRRNCHGLQGIARLKDGVTMQAALAEMKGIAANLERQYPDSNRGQGAALDPLSEIIVGDVRPILLTLLTGAALLLAIACVNVASLLLVRSESRRKEIAVRGALGASRIRLLVQFLLESTLLVALGGTLGIVVAALAMRVLARLIPKFMISHLPFLIGPGLNTHVLAFACCLALLALILFAATPALRLRVDNIRESLASSSRGSAGTLWRRVGANLVVVELAIAVVLLVGAGLLGKSFYRLIHVDLNFHPDHLAMVGVIVPVTLYAKDADLARMQRQILAKATELPDVESAGITTVPPVSFDSPFDWIRFVGRAYNGEHNVVNHRDITAGYMRTLQAKLLRGRFFTSIDDETHPKVAIVNKTLAKLYYPGQDPIGQRFGDTDLAPESIKEIVGVVDDIREGPLDSQIWPAVYEPIDQNESNYFTLIARTGSSEGSMLPTLVSAVRSVNAGLGTADPIGMEERIRVGPTAYAHRSAAWLVGGFAVLAFLLSVTGVYGVIAYSVGQRNREIGIRMALGAGRDSVCKLVLREAGWLAMLGIALGLACSVGAATLMQKLLFATPAWDAATLAAVAAVLGAAAMLASYIPANRAAYVNPVEALRAE
jgi:macrolide transport system ATP-binding/permease protein